MKITISIITSIIAIGAAVLLNLYASQSFINGFVITAILLHGIKPLKDYKEVYFEEWKDSTERLQSIIDSRNESIEKLLEIVKKIKESK